MIYQLHSVLIFEGLLGFLKFLFSGNYSVTQPMRLFLPQKQLCLIEIFVELQPGSEKHVVIWNYFQLSRLFSLAQNMCFCLYSPLYALHHLFALNQTSCWLLETWEVGCMSLHVDRFLHICFMWWKWHSGRNQIVCNHFTMCIFFFLFYEWSSSCHENRLIL